MLRLRSALCAVALVFLGTWTLAAPAAGAAPRGAQPDACALVTDAELEPVAGYALDAGEAIVASAKVSACSYESSDAAAGPDVGIGVTTTATGNAKKLFAVKELEKAFGKSKKVPDLGTRANFAFKKGKASQAALLVVDGNNGVEVILRGTAARGAALAESQAIATLVLTKLP